MLHDPNMNWEKVEYLEACFSILEFNAGLILSFYNFIFRALAALFRDIQPVLFGKHYRYVPSDWNHFFVANLFLVTE